MNHLSQKIGLIFLGELAKARTTARSKISSSGAARMARSVPARSPPGDRDHLAPRPRPARGSPMPRA